MSLEAIARRFRAAEGAHEHAVWSVLAHGCTAPATHNSSARHLGAPIVLHAFASAAMAQLVQVPRPPAHQVGTEFARSVAGLLDTNCDGLGDSVAGAPGASELPPQIQQRGRAYISSGSGPGFLRAIRPPFDRGMLDQSFGWIVAGLGDVDGDGAADFAVSSHLDGPPGSPRFAGRVYVFSGATGALLHSLRSPLEHNQSNFGLSLAPVPDCDGDGRSEIVAGCEHEQLYGRLHLFSGASGHFIRTLVSPNPNLPQGSFGRTVAGGWFGHSPSTQKPNQPPYTGLGETMVRSSSPVDPENICTSPDSSGKPGSTRPGTGRHRVFRCSDSACIRFHRCIRSVRYAITPVTTLEKHLENGV